MATVNYIPMVECPSCFHEFQWNDYYEIATGHERECPHCEATVIVTSVDRPVVARVEVKGFHEGKARHE